MLAPMDIPWLVLGVVGGVGLVVLAGLTTALLLRRRPGRGPGRPAPLQDDLPGFLEFPPGSTAAPAGSGWASLAPATPAPAPPRGRRNALVVAAAMAGTALLLIGAAAAIAAASSGADDRPRAHRSAPGGPTAARLTFGGVVLEPRAVGVTATYPVVQIWVDGERSRARVELPTYNCLAGDAPPDPVAAGCIRSVTEYAELASPDLDVARDGSGLVVSGRFPTELRPNGGPPVPTGRSYELRITVTPAGRASADGWRPADGVLQLGTGRARTVDGVSELRSGS